MILLDYIYHSQRSFFTVLKLRIDVSLSGKGDSVSHMIQSIAESVDSNLSNVIQISTQVSADTQTQSRHTPLPSNMLRQPGSHQRGELASQPTYEGGFSLRDLSYLPRREFKVQGGQVGDTSSDISYNNICKQMDGGFREGFSESEIARGVLKMIRPGIFRNMLINIDDITINELKGFLQTHLRIKK